MADFHLDSRQPHPLNHTAVSVQPATSPNPFHIPSLVFFHLFVVDLSLYYLYVALFLIL